mgnify:FL=1
MTSIEVEKYLEEIRRKEANKNKLNFNNFIAVKYKQKIEDLDKTIRELNKNIENYQIDLVSFVRDVKEQDYYLLSLKDNINNIISCSEKEYEKLMKISKIKDITCTNNCINLFTSNIYIDEKDITRKKNVIYFIGKFMISIYLDGKIRFYNQTNLGDGPGFTLPKDFDANYTYNRHHPHINAEGIACLGNLSSVIPKYIAEGSISVIAILLIKFLETVYIEDGAGKGIYWWPIVTEKEN